MTKSEKVIQELEWLINRFDNYERGAMDDEEISSLKDAICLLKAQDVRIKFLEEKLRLLEFGDNDVINNVLMPAT